MSYSTIAIYNLALARLGGHQFTNPVLPDDGSLEARLCRTLYPHCLQTVLEAFPWSFAAKRARLALRPDGAVPNQHGYPFRFALPVDCLYPVRLDGEGKDHFPPPYIIEGGDIVTGQADAVLTYIAKQDDPTRWPAHFVDALAWLLAAELSTSLINDARRQQAYLQKYEAVLLEARTLDLRKQQLEGVPSVWLEARG